MTRRRARRAAARGSSGVRALRRQGAGSDPGAPETCPVSTGKGRDVQLVREEGTRRVRLVREGGGGGGTRARLPRAGRGRSCCCSAPRRAPAPRSPPRPETCPVSTGGRDETCPLSTGGRGGGGTGTSATQPPAPAPAPPPHARHRGGSRAPAPRSVRRGDETCPVSTGGR